MRKTDKAIASFATAGEIAKAGGMDVIFPAIVSPKITLDAVDARIVLVAEALEAIAVGLHDMAGAIRDLYDKK